MDKLKLLKGVVVLLTSLIVLGIAAVIIGLAGKNDKPATVAAGEAAGGGQASFAVVTTPAGTLETVIAEGKGSFIDKVASCGDGVCLMIKGGGLPDRIVMLNAKGVVVRKIKLTQE